MRLTCTYIHYCIASFVWCGILRVMGPFCSIWQSILHNLKVPFLIELLSSRWSWFACWFGIEWKLSELQKPVAENFSSVWPMFSLFPAHYFLQHLLSWLVLMSSSSTGAWGNSELTRQGKRKWAMENGCVQVAVPRTSTFICTSNMWQEETSCLYTATTEKPLSTGYWLPLEEALCDPEPEGAITDTQEKAKLCLFCIQVHINHNRLFP